MPNEYVFSGATVSPCRRYRRTLIRRWNGKPDARNRFALWVMLNPSTADATKDDPTIRRCVGFSKSWDLGLDGLVVENLWDWRSTDWDALNDRIGEKCSEENYLAILHGARRAKLIIAAWGQHAMKVKDGQERILNVVETLRNYNDVHILRLNLDGQPAHPLMLPGNLRPWRWWRQI